MTTGQITRGDEFGNLLYELAKREDINNIVEIGTWTGLGSTKCIIDGLLERSNQNYNFITVELYPEMYEAAKNNLKGFLNDKIKILKGRLIDPKEVFWFDHSTINFDGDSHARLYYKTDLLNLYEAEDISKELPDKIDLLILDGGEYTTYPEYCKLKTKTKFFALDDTSILKCSRVRRELLDSGATIIYDNQSIRNGCGVYEKGE